LSAAAKPEGRIAPARRLDGKPLERADGFTYKSHALTGKRWQLRLGAVPQPPDTAAAVMLCEGETHFLAAFHFIAQWGEPRLYPVAMLGRTQGLRPEAVERLKGWRIRVYPHADADGLGFAAAVRWAAAITGAVVDAFDFRGALAGPVGIIGHGPNVTRADARATV
jgi:hypothetical protein